MLILVPEVLSKAEVMAVRRIIDAGEWIDGNATSGHQSALAKRNSQLREQSPAAAEAGDRILDRLSASPLFVSAALPFKVFPSLFNRYEGGGSFGMHVDNAVRALPNSNFRIRSDLSATLFLSEPADYEGGDLIVQDTYGVHSVRFAAGDMVLYSASSLHRVSPVTNGARVASFFWIQSMVRETEERRMMFELDQIVQKLTVDRGGRDDEIVGLTGIYHNLLRKWGDL
jgi:PKHD-type hydroxylase